MTTKPIAIVVGVIVLALGMLLGGVLVGVTATEEVNTGSYLRVTCGSDNVALRFDGPLTAKTAFTASELQHLTGKTTCTAITAANMAKKTDDKGVCDSVPPTLSSSGDLTGAGKFCDFDWKPIDLYSGAKALKNLVPLVYYAAIVVIGVSLMSIGLAGYAGRGPLAN